MKTADSKTYFSYVQDKNSREQLDIFEVRKLALYELEVNLSMWYDSQSGNPRIGGENAFGFVAIHKQYQPHLVGVNLFVSSQIDESSVVSCFSTAKTSFILEPGSYHIHYGFIKSFGNDNQTSLFFTLREVKTFY